jgi:hypothetical protein
VQVLVPPPYSPYLYDYQAQYADRNAIILTNTTRQTVNVMLRGELTGRNNGIRVYTGPNYRPKNIIELLPGQPQRFTLAESNQDFLDQKNLEVVGVDDATRTQVLTTGLLPPGSYDLCILAYRYENGQPVGSPFRGCTFLNIAYLETPRLIQPLCGREILIRPNEPNQTLFSWNPPVGNINGARLVYDFYLVKVPPGQNPNDAINNAIDRRVGNPFIERDLSTTFFNYGVAEPPLSEGLYVWRVVARDPDRRTVFQNQGRSEFCQFTARNGLSQSTTAVIKSPVLVQPPAAQKPVILSGPMQTMNLAAPGVSPCKDVVAPADNAPVAGNYLNQTVKIGKFDLTIDDITAAGNVYTGKGRVRWNGVPIRVSYTNIQLNASKQVIAGWANGIDEAFRMPGVDLGSTDLNGLQQLDGSNLKTYAENLKNNLYDQAKAAVAVPLPLGYDAGSGLIGINYMRFTPTGADMGIVFNMEMPEADSYLALAGVGICMAPDKIIPNNVLLYLVKDLKVPSTPLTFNKGNLAPVNPSGTFAEWNAIDGLKRVHGELGLNLGSGFLQLDDGNGNMQPGDVTATLKVDFTKWADWVADVQMPPAFGLSALSGVTLKGVSVTYDHSDLRNPAGFAPPAEYTGERGPTFQGVYLAEMQVLLPKSFLDQKGNRTGFAAKGCLFTAGEFTGRLAPATKPLLDYNTGSLGKWGFSIDDFEVLFVQNRFERGGMNGKIQFPISNDYFNYTTTLRENFKNLQFLVQPKPGGYKVPLWAADMNIVEGSQILVGLKNGDPVMDMQLHGNVTINSSNLPKVVSLVLPNLYFENLTVSNLPKPGTPGGGGVYVNPGNWELVGGIFKKSPPPAPAPGARQSNGPSEPETTGEISGEMVADNEGGLAGFPIEIAPPKMFIEGTGFGVELGAYVSLGETSANIANASGFVRILGEIKLVNNRPQPALKDVYPSRLGIKGDFGGGTVDAAIDFYKEDQKFGTGFKGVGMVNMPALAEVDATVQFGKVNGFYYAYADASVVIAGGIPIAPPTPLVINGFKGGFYYNMAPDKWVMPTPVDLDPKNPPPPAPVNPAIGYTNSKTGYSPVRNGWGIKAGIFLAVADRHLMNSLVEVEASFNGSALSTFLLKGQANVMDTDARLETKGDAMMTAMAAFEHDVAQKSYLFSVEIKGQWPGVPVPLTIPFEAYFDPQHYHVKLGDPFAHRIEASILNVDVGLIKASLVANAYVAFGNDLPGMPALPPDVERFLGSGENPTNSGAATDQRQYEFGRVASSGVTYSNGPKSAPVGGDFMVLLGAGLDANLKVSVFPLTINAKGSVGFDAALYHNSMCKDNTVAAGLFGWYGKATMYAYLAGSIDIEVDLLGVSGSFQLCKLEAGALFQGGVPNPTWAEGRVRAKGNILDGLVDFNASVNVAFGQKCEPHYTGDPLAKVVIIQELRPTGDKPVATDATLTAVFNIGMNREYTVRLPDDTERTYQFGIDSYRLIYTDKANKRQEFKGLHEPIWADNDQLLLLPVSSGQLMSRRPHTFTVTANIKEKVSDGYGGSKFNYLYDATKKPRTESKTVTFTTGDQYDGIRFQDVEYQYPLDGQLYTLKGQVPQGLVVGPLPNEALEKPGYRLEAVFVPKEPGPSLRVPFTYNSGIIPGSKSQTSKVVFAWPAGLQNEKTYRLELHRIYNTTNTIGSGIQPGGTKVTIPVSVGVKNERSLNQLENKTTTGIQGTATTRKNTLSGDIQMSGNAIVADKILYSFNFRTSRYNTFAEKVAAMRFAPTSYANGTNSARADYLTFDLEPTGSVENFEDSELFGYKSAKGPQPAMLESRPLPPNSHAYPYEDWVLKNVYDPLFKFDLLGGADVSFNLFTELNDGGWMTNFSAAAMQNRRGIVPLSLKANSTILALSSGTTTRQAGSATASASQQAGLSASSTLAIKPLLSAQSSSQSTIKLVSAFQMDLFALNDEPDRSYKFFVQRDRISFFDWQAVNNFGTTLYAAREQARKVADASVWQSLFHLPMMEPVTVSASSPTITLSTSYRYLSDMPNELIDRYPVYPGTFASNNQFKTRFAGSTGGVLLRYIPYSGGPRQEVSKEFQFKGSIVSPGSTNPR